MKMKKGEFFKVNKTQFMKNGVAEYHSSFLSSDNETVLHNMIYRNKRGLLEIGSFGDDAIYYEIADGMIL